MLREMKIKDSKHASAPIGWLFLVPEFEFLQLIPGSFFLFYLYSLKKIEIHINLFSHYMKAGGVCCPLNSVWMLPYVLQPSMG